MALLVDHEPLLVVTRGDQRVDMHKARSSAVDCDGISCSMVSTASTYSPAARQRVLSSKCAGMQEHHPVRNISSSSAEEAASSSGNRLLPGVSTARRQLHGAVCLACCTPPVAAAAARRLRLLRLV
jgi:hypothetical protein